MLFEPLIVDAVAAELTIALVILLTPLRSVLAWKTPEVRVMLPVPKADLLPMMTVPAERINPP